MKIFTISDEFIVVKGDKSAEAKYRKTISQKVIEKFGKHYFPAATVTEILVFIRDYFISEFENRVTTETSLRFFKEVVWLHEQAINLRSSDHYHTLPEGIDKSYISGYRRVLKMIIEQGCRVEMVTGEKYDENFLKRIHPILNDLLFLGEMLYAISESLAEQTMVEDSIDISFDKNDLYVISRRHHYEFIFSHIWKMQESDTPDYVMDKKGSVDFRKAVQEHFGLEYDKIWQVIVILMEEWKLPYCACVSADCEGFVRDIAGYCDVSPESIKNFLSGMTLSKENMLSMTDLLKKPHSLNRLLYRPFLVWSIAGKPYYVFGTASLFEAEHSLHLNAIPWQKIPFEWEKNNGFKKYAQNKHDEHDKWLDDQVEKIIRDERLVYQRTVKRLDTKSESYSLLVKDLGEIDFIILSPAVKKIWIADCKHLIGRYDMVNQLNDYDHFVKDGKHKSYNTRLQLKVDWLTENIQVLEEHFQLREKNPSLSLDGYQLEGIFFINTPTFYMYNSAMRIFTHDHVRDVITGKYIDPEFSCLVEDDYHVTTYFIKYPYFRKPNLMYYENEDDDYEVDKYGYPIKP